MKLCFGKYRKLTDIADIDRESLFWAYTHLGMSEAERAMVEKELGISVPSAVLEKMREDTQLLCDELFAINHRYDTWRCKWREHAEEQNPEAAQ